jgi:hypothetical protein
VFFGIIGSLVVLSRLEKESRNNVIRVLPAVALAAAAWIAVSIRRSLARRRERLRFPQLSSDELRVARSKLMKERDRKSV